MKPIYQASIEERLQSVIRCAEFCLNLHDFRREVESKFNVRMDCVEETLAPGEFAIGDWIVRPRFDDKEDQ